MKNFQRLLLTISLLAVCSVTYGDEEEIPQHENWLSNDETHGATLLVLPGAKDEESVRAQIAGVLDTLGNDDFLLFPTKIEKGFKHGMDAFVLHGECYAQEDKQYFIISMFFGNKDTFMLYEYSYDELLDEREAPGFKIEDKQLSCASSGIEYVTNNFDGNLHKFQAIISNVIELQKGIVVETDGGQNSGGSASSIVTP